MQLAAVKEQIQMISRFQDYIQRHELFSNTDKLLVAVSGGVDSMVLCSLLSSLNYNIGVAHCNFGLRGKESDKDELFVRRFAQELEVPFHVTRFNTEHYAKEKRVSTQMAARELRYIWFEKVRMEEGYNYILTAHHQNDAVETFFINMLRGSGIAGLSGISTKKDKLVRPLLEMTKQEILLHAKANNIPYREDASNASNKYVRNNIRNTILPLIRELNPSFDKTLAASIEHLKEVELIYNDAIEKERNNIVTMKGNELFITIETLLKTKAPSSYLFEYVKRFGFSSLMVNNVMDHLKGSSGKLFYSSTHKLLIDRNYIIVKPIDQSTGEKTILLNNTEGGEVVVFNNSEIKTEVVDGKLIDINVNKDIALLDFRKIQFPLTLRKWKYGDRFIPLGMKGFKKLSDYFIDNKISRFEKEESFVILSGGEIVWLVGHRIDERFKVDASTKQAFRLMLNKLD